MAYVGNIAAKIVAETVITKRGIDIARGGFFRTNSGRDGLV